MQVPLTGHLREPAHVRERLTRIAVTRPSLPPSPPLSVVERVAVAAAAGLAAAVLFSAVTVDAEPSRSDSECREVWAAGRWTSELVDVDREAFLDACTEPSGN